ncbi:hypothetical protein [Streptomyces sp. NPDC102282]|uniref:hypothetical protein n=1 Tax=Streptomyces sp. NPDC102282 TaxID=3366154 RepID=UPI0038010A64
MGVSVVIAASVSGVVFWVGVICLVAAVLAFIMCIEEIQARRTDAQPAMIARQHSGRYVCPCDIQQEDRDLLLRAATAVERILTSTAHELDTVDKVRNNTELPEILWKVAKDVEKIDQLAMKHWGASAASAGAAVDSVLSSQASALQTSRDHVSARIMALEEYAKRAGVIDDLIAQQAQIEQLEGANSEYLDLVAQTSGDDAAAQRVALIGEEAVVAAGPIAEAVRRARDAAELALPDKS